MNKQQNYQPESQFESQAQPSTSTPDGYDLPSGPVGNSTHLHAVLQTALGSLDIDMEEELARYRRQAPGRVQRSRQQAMAYVAALAGKSPSESPESLAIAPSQATQATQAPLPPAPAPAEEEASLHANMTHFAAAQSAAPAPHSNPAPDGYLESSEELLRSLEDLHTPFPEPEPAAQKSDRFPGLLASLLTPLGVGSVMLLILSSATLGYLVVNPSVVTRLTSPSNDAPGSVSDGTASGRPDGISPDLSSTEFDPLNLNRLSSIPSERDLGYLENPAEGTDGEAESDTAPSSELSSENGELPTVAVPSTSASQPSTVTPAPAQPARRAAPAPAPARTAPQAAPQPAAALPRVAPAPAPARSTPRSNPTPSNTSQPSPRSRSATAPAAPSPSSNNSSGSSSATPAPSSNAATASAPASQEDYVYVVTPYTGDSSLEQAQEAVSGAYVRNSPGGAQVQMGAFSSPQGAQDLVEELNNQGIPAQIQD
ncbi:MAG: SPOR domain-containing protein [Elainellaceae cyanobacterium]